jgi:germination protein M
MKRIMPFFLASVILLLLAACVGGKDSSGDSELSVYRVIKSEYLNSGELVRAEKLILDENADLVQSAANAFVSYPKDDETACALPEGVEITAAEQTGVVAKLTMNEAYRTLHGIEKTLADYCLTLTMCSLPDINYVSIYVGDEVVESRLSPDDIVLENTAVSADEVGVRIYFPNASGTGLGCEYRTVTLSDDSSAERLVMDALLSGPESENLAPALGADCVLLSVYTSGDICTVSFAEGFLSNESLSDTQIKLSIYSIVNSLTSLSEVTGVQFLIEGKPIQSIGGTDTSLPLSAKKSI